MVLLNYRDSKPIYAQIKDGLRRQILSGVLIPESKLSSVREMASELAINPNTIQRSYRELEAEGFIYSVAGKGSFVSNLSEIDDTHRQHQLKKMEELVAELLHLGTKPEELIQRIEKIAKEDSK